MFRHLSVILKKFQKFLFPAKLHKFLKVRLFKLKLPKIIRLKILSYYLYVDEWYNKFCAPL
jgi:hypothetical protein